MTGRSLPGGIIDRSAAGRSLMVWTPSTTDTRASNLHLLRDCLALGKPAARRPPAKVRLEEALGPELARKLLTSLAAKRR